jgi:hypothetical protein
MLSSKVSVSVIQCRERMLPPPTCLVDQKSVSDSLPLITTARCSAASSGSLKSTFFLRRNILAANSFTGSIAGTFNAGGGESGGSSSFSDVGVPAYGIDSHSEGTERSEDVTYIRGPHVHGHISQVCGSGLSHSLPNKGFNLVTKRVTI